jgi:glycosyltransferase involved in cell wall biosynthesis
MEIKLNHYIKKNIKKNITAYNYEKDLPDIIEYVKLLRGNNYNNNISYYSTIKPKVSFIATVFNKSKYLNSFIFSIQNQNLKEFELIFVDDYSTDKSVEIIKKIQKKDKRIKLLTNNKNLGSLYSRYKGAIHSKGEYLIFVDSDDIVLKEGILNSYNYIKEHNLDILEFNSVFERNSSTIYISRRYFKYSNIIYQPILSYIFFYNKNKGTESNTALWDKLIKKEVILKSFEYIGKKYLNKKIIIENDVIILFSLFRNSNSFQYIDELGYYYFFNNNDSITNTRYDPLKADEVIYSIFTNLEFLYEKTGNTFLDKYYCLFKLKTGYKKYKPCFKYLNQFNLVENILNKLLQSNYISKENKIIINNIKKEIKCKNFM